METLDNEELVLEQFRMLHLSEIRYFGRRLPCFRVVMLTKCFLFSKSWKDSSSKSDCPPDFHNIKHHIMMEIMRIDDCVEEINGKHVNNSFARERLTMKKLAGENYKSELNGSLYFVADTRNNKEFNIYGYYKNFERVLSKHSNKVELYRKNYPKCKICVLLVFDESNDYVQLTDKTLFKDGSPYGEIKIHNYYMDKNMLSVIKESKADYVIWMTRFKSLYVNGKSIKTPRACIYDVKHFKQKGIEYDYKKMYKVTEQVDHL